MAILFKMIHRVKILKIETVAQNIKRFVVEKPKGYEFTPGQATLVAINKPGWNHKQRPFTFTSLNSDLFLEFIIKIYGEKGGVTNALNMLKEGEVLSIREPFGSISYKGKGVFMAGGTGITPFIAIFRQLFRDSRLKGNKVIFSNRTSKDIILEKELKEMFKKEPENLILVLTEEKNKSYLNQKIDKNFLIKHIKDFSQYFYICGPELFVMNIMGILKGLGVKKRKIVIEKDF